MPTHGHPRLPGFDQRWPVEAQCHNGCPPDGRQAIDPISLGCPRKVFLPYLVARIKEPHNFICERIKCGDPVAFVIVAERASQPEIIFFGEAAERLWNDVVNLHRRAHNGLGSEAIATPMAGLRGNFRA